MSILCIAFGFDGVQGSAVPLQEIKLIGCLANYITDYLANWIIRYL
jgi:hypothetical protein